MDSLPPQPDDTAWPTTEWSTGSGDSRVDRPAIERVFARLFAASARTSTGETHALLLVHGGKLVAERYSAEHSRRSSFCSWSMAKSITHALVGTLVRDGKLRVEEPAPVPEWQGEGDPRGKISLEQLLRMVDGLEFEEDYVDRGVSHVIEMLFGAGKDDVVAYAVARPPAHEPGSVWSYSSGTSNVVSGILSRVVGEGEAGMRAFMARELFDRIGMRSAEPRFDAAGNFIASSYVFATARDFARFGLLYLRDGVWEGERLLPEGWVDHGRRLTPASAGEYGAHWWLATDGSGIFNASGYNGQYLAIDPRRDLVMLRLGASVADQRGAVFAALSELDQAFAAS